MPDVDVAQLQDDLDKGNLLGDEAEAARKAIEEAEAAKKAEEDDDEAKKAEEEAAKKAEEEAAKKAEEEAGKAKKDESKEDDDSAAAAAKDADAGDDDEKAKAEAKKEIDKRIKIPKFRYDAANARAKKAEARVAELEAENEKLKVTKPDDSKKADERTPQEQHDAALADIDSQIAEAMKDGKPEDVTKLMAQSRKLEREFQAKQSAAKMEESSNMTREQVLESNKLNAVLDQLETQYPIFDETHDNFSQEANDEVLKLQKAFIATGNTPSDALIEAVNIVLPKYYTDDEAGEEDKGEKDESKKADKKKTVEKNVDAAKRQAPDMDDAGEDSDAAGAKDDLPNAMELTDDEYDALPEETKRRMRGDDF